MDGDRTHRALARIDSALARLEAAAQRPAQTDDQLAARHARLRATVTETLGKLDSLIASQAR